MIIRRDVKPLVQERRGGGLRSFMKNEMGPVGVLPCELYPQKKVLNQKHCGLFYTYWTLYGP